LHAEEFMSFGAYMTVHNATSQPLAVAVSDVPGLKDNADDGSPLSRFNTTIRANTGFPANLGAGRGAYIETGGASPFTLTFSAGGATIGAVRFSAERGAYGVSSNTAPARLLVSIHDGGARAGDNTLAVIVVVLLEWPLNPATWMTDFPALSGLPLGGICIPASHDSGTWTIHSPLGKLAPGAVITQTLDIAGQLAVGARYFDVRPALGDDGLLYHGHGPIRCAALSDILSQASAFASANPREVVFINFSHMDSSSIQQQAWTQIVAALGPQMAPASSAVTTLGSLQSSGTNVVVFFDGSPDQTGKTGFLWSPNTIDHWNDYADSDRTSDLTTFIASQMQGENRVAGNFWLLQCQLTQTVADGVLSEFDSAFSILGFAAKSKPVVQQQLLDVSQPPGSTVAQTFAKNANFFMVDAVDASWMQIAVIANIYRLIGL
jgi:hypothetical protein